jgi:hypothetical protein
MQFRYLIFIIFSTLLYSSCQESGEKVSGGKNYRLVLSDSLLLEADSTTNYFSSCINTFKENGREKLAYLSETDNSINIYDIESRKAEKKLVLEKEGVNGVGEGRITMHYINADSIIIAAGDYSWFVMNIQGQVKYKLNLYQKHQEKGGLIFAQGAIEGGTPAILRGKELWAAVYPYVSSNDIKALKNFPIIYKINLKDSSVSAPINLPADIYTRGIYGVNFIGVSYAYNEATEELALSYPADPRVEFYHLPTGRSRRVLAVPTSFGNGEIEPSKAKEMTGMEGFAFFTRVNSYSKIYYDPYRKLYYRFAEEAVDEARFEAKKFWKYKILMVFNEQMELIQEINFRNISIWPPMCFVGEKGFYAGISDNDESEDVIKFHLFTLQEAK